MPSVDDSTNNIAQLMGLLDPWYERNVLSFLDLPVDVLCQVCLCTLSPILASQQQSQTAFCVSLKLNNWSVFILNALT